MHLMIFDPHERGHYLSYVRYLLTSVPPASQLTLVLRQGIEAAEPYQQQLGPHVGSATLDCAIRTESYREGNQLREDFESACGRHKPDHVWIPSGDLLLRSCNLARVASPWRNARRPESECGLIELRFHRSPKRLRSQVRQYLERLLLKAGSLNRLKTIDPTVVGWLSKHDRMLARRFSLVPDPVEDAAPIAKIEARRTLGIPEDGRYVGSVGVHAVPRKGSELLIEAFAQTRLGADDRLLLAGPLGRRLQDQLNTTYAHLHRSGKIIVVDEYLDRGKLMNALAACDLVCTPYFDHLGSSAIVLQSAQVGRPVLAPHQGWFADMIPTFELGATGDILSVPGLARAIERQIESAAAFRTSAATARLLDYSSFRNFARSWAARLRERLRLPPDVNVRSWQWVMEGMGDSADVGTNAAGVAREV